MASSNPLLVPYRGRTLGPSLPLHFLPIDRDADIGPSALHDLGVAAKLEYTRNRWLDEMVDAIRPSPVPLSAHP